MKLPPAFTILIPTHDHADTLWYSVQSALCQSRQDFELFIVGDGVPDRTREIAAALTSRDPRIRFFDNPKGERHGEAHRHIALQQAAGQYVCYLSDDDLWFPDHLEQMAKALEIHDLAHTMQIEVQPDGQLNSWMFDAMLEPDALDRMRRSETGFGLASGGHSLAAYSKLSHGWHPAPKAINSDLYFWLQFLDQPECRYFSLKWPTMVHFSSVSRKSCSGSQRVAELAEWWPRIQNAKERSRMVMEVLLPINAELYGLSRQPRAPVGQTVTLVQEAALKAQIEQLQVKVIALRNSLSWKLTKPLRRLADFLKAGR